MGLLSSAFQGHPKLREKLKIMKVIQFLTLGTDWYRRFKQSWHNGYQGSVTILKLMYEHLGKADSFISDKWVEGSSSPPWRLANPEKNQED